MTTAVSIPDPLLKAAEALARSGGLSRDELFAEALTEYVARRTHRPSATEIAEQVNRVCGETDTSLDAFARDLQARSLPKEDW